MQDPVVHPLVDKAFQEINSRIRGPIACPCCKGTDWDRLAEIVRVMAFIDRDTESVEEANASFSTAVAVCTNCGFMRMHVVRRAV
jgi:hypothetical protein